MVPRRGGAHPARPKTAQHHSSNNNTAKIKKTQKPKKSLKK
jgi:hypothetical protein